MGMLELRITAVKPGTRGERVGTAPEQCEAPVVSGNVSPRLSLLAVISVRAPV